MKRLTKLVLFAVLFSAPIAAHAGAVNWLYFGVGFLGEANIGLTNYTPYSMIIGIGQRFSFGKVALYTAENINIIKDLGTGDSLGFGFNANLDLAYKLVGEKYSKKGFELEALAGVFVEFDLALSSLQLAYGPELGVNAQYWFTPGFGLNLQAKSGFNVSGWGNIIFPSFGLSMTWRPVTSPE